VGIPLYSITDSLIHGKAITSENVTNIIKTITETKMYSEQAKKLGKLFRFAGGAKRAADLVEFYAEVGYDHLVPAYAKYEWSWVVYYNLDVYFLLSLLSFLLIYSTYAITKRCCCKYCRSNDSSNKIKKD
jgi:glucuronosyltransferase